MDWATYKTNFNESFEVDGNTGFVKMDVIQGHCFKVGSIIFFHHIGLHLVLRVTLPVSANEFSALSQKRPRSSHLSLPLPIHMGWAGSRPRSSKVMEGKPEVTPVTPDHLYMEIQGRSSQKASFRRKEVAKG